MTQVSRQPNVIFREKFRIKNLKKIYREEFSNTQLKGVDRINSQHFSARFKEEIKIISTKSLRGEYKFSPYLEQLKGRGRSKCPRLLAVPTLRDRIAIYALKETLFEIFPDCVKRKFANQHVKDIKEILKEHESADLGFFRTDITNFYGSLNRDNLMDFLRKRIRSKRINLMIERAITRPVVPKVYRRQDLHNYEITGIPQGLSISNLLAEIYLHELDQLISQKSEVIYYDRYVDDILIITQKPDLPEITSWFRREIENKPGLGLALNQDKTISNCDLIDTNKLTCEFDYIGYSFSPPKVSPQKQSEEKFLRSIFALFSEYKKSLEAKSKSKKRVKTDLLKKTFLFRLNEKLTGAISEKRKYGWVFFYLEISDLSPLYRVDHIVSQLFQKLESFNHAPPDELKKIVRAYYHALYTPTSGYIHDYSLYRDDASKKAFLLQNGYIEFNKRYSPKKIRQAFEKVKHANLSNLIEDESFLY